MVDRRNRKAHTEQHREKVEKEAKHYEKSTLSFASHRGSPSRNFLQPHLSRSSGFALWSSEIGTKVRKGRKTSQQSHIEDVQKSKSNLKKKKTLFNFTNNKSTIFYYKFV